MADDNGLISRTAAPLRKQVVDAIRHRIVTNVYAPGTRLVERVVCEELGVSRTVVREAFRQLEAERLIEVLATFGPVVRTLSASETKSLYEVRAALESLAAHDCAERASDDLIGRLHEALLDVPAPGVSDIEQRLDAQDRFIALIVEGADNMVLGDLLTQIHSRVNLLRARTLQHGGAERQLPGLTLIYNAIAQRDPAGAEAATRAYVLRASEIALEDYAERSKSVS